MEKFKIETDYIKLDQFLKWIGLAESGVMAKELILAERVMVNGEVETRRGKKLYKNDTVSFAGVDYIIQNED